MILAEAKLIDVEGKAVELFDDKELKSLGDYLPDMDYNGILIPKEAMTSEEAVSFFEGFGIKLSVIDDLSYWNCTFENCTLTTVNYGNGLFGDGSISPSIKLVFCEKPNEYWRGY